MTDTRDVIARLLCIVNADDPDRPVEGRLLWQFYGDEAATFLADLADAGMVIVKRRIILDSVGVLTDGIAKRDTLECWFCGRKPIDAPDILAAAGGDDAE